MDEMSVRIGELAAMLELTTRRVQQLVSGGILPRPTKSGYPLRDAVRGYIRHVKANHSADPAQLRAERLRLYRAKARREELEVGRLEGNFLLVEEVRKVAFATGRNLRTAMENIVPRVETIIAAESDVARVRAILASEISAALSCVADELEAPPGNGGGSNEKHVRAARGEGARK